MVSLDSLERAAFRQYWLGMKRRWKPALFVFIVATTLAAVGASMQKSTYGASSKLLLRPNRVPALTGLGGGGDLAAGIGGVSNLTVQSNPLKTETETILSRPLLAKTIALTQLKDPKGKPIEPEALAKQIKLKDVAGADVLKLSYDSTSPQQAAAVLNTLMNLYVERNLQINRSEATAARQFIANQLPRTAETVRSADLALRAFKERNNIADLDSENKLATQALSDLENQITRSRSDLSEASSRALSLQDKLGMDSQQALVATTLSQSAGVQKALTQFQDIQSQLEVERTKYQDQHPKIVNLQGQAKALQGQLQERITEAIGNRPVDNDSLYLSDVKRDVIRDFVKAEVDRLSTANRLNALSTARNFYRQRIGALPKLEQEQRELQRQLEVAQTTYASLMKKLQEVELAEKQNVGTARIIEAAAVPDKPSGSQKVMLMGIGLMAAAILALGTVVILEMGDPSLKTIAEVRNLFGYPWLGTIPQYGKPQKLRRKKKRQDYPIPELPVRDVPRSATSAAYRMLHANIKFARVDDHLKSIVVTSSVSKEGKSTIAANLAATMAALGRRTLLIDADLHNPTQHHIWNLTNAQGLSHIIAGQAKFNGVVNHVVDCLDVLTAGVITPNPLALIDSRRMISLVEGAEDRYDMVIIDAPPLTAEVEALALGKISDGVLMVVRPGVVDLESASIAKELLKQSSQTILGMVINGSTPETDHRAFYAYDQLEPSSTLPSRIPVVEKEEEPINMR